MSEVLVFDIEVFKDYFLVAFRNIATGNVARFEKFDGKALNSARIKSLLTSHTVVGFNSITFDWPILSYALIGATCEQLKKASDAVIMQNLRGWQLCKQFGFNEFAHKDVNHIDLIEVAPGFASLKTYAGRMHLAKLQDLPIEPDASISPEYRKVLSDYCGNDLIATEALYRTLLQQIELRKKMTLEYGINLLSKSDAQIAEAVIKSEVEKTMKTKIMFRSVDVGQQFHYTAPKWMRFKTKSMKDALKMVTGVTFSMPDSGQVKMPPELVKATVAIGGGVYRMGIGGLHSSETCIAHHSDDEHKLIDRDVASYYPNLILTLCLEPEQMAGSFLGVYRTIVEKRLAAKAAGDTVTADSLKICVNGSFGKLGSKYSALYAPELLIQVTLTGQLALLMLIEALEEDGIPVVSANTDGVVMKVPRAYQAKADAIVAKWEERTSLQTDATEYAALYSRDVNNYIAIKPGGGMKLKGAYARGGLAKNPNNEVCIGAVAKYLTDRVSVEDTIASCQDITKFLTVRKVAGGAIKDGAYLGKTIRWYYSLVEAGVIQYKSNGYRVPRTEGAAPCMDLPGALPVDMDHQWYVNEALSILEDIGAIAKE